MANFVEITSDTHSVVIEEDGKMYIISPFQEASEATWWRYAAKSEHLVVGWQGAAEALHFRDEDEFWDWVDQSRNEPQDDDKDPIHRDPSEFTLPTWFEWGASDEPPF